MQMLPLGKNGGRAPEISLYTNLQLCQKGKQKKEEKNQVLASLTEAENEEVHSMS